MEYRDDEFGKGFYEINPDTQTWGKIEIEENEEMRELKRSFYKKKALERLQDIFAKKANALKAIAINKPYMANPRAIQEQYDSYEALYQQAKDGTFDTNTNLAIITANERAKKRVGPVNLFLNSVRSIIERTIENGDIDTANAMLDKAEVITAESLKNLEALRGEFGL